MRSLISSTGTAVAFAALACYSAVPLAWCQSCDESDQPPPPLRLGIIGASNVATFAVIGPASDNPDVAVRAVAARSRSRAASYAKSNQIPVVHETYEQLLEDPDVDAVYIGVITELHFPLARLALESRKHVLLEKPGVFTAAEASELAGLARGANRVLLEAFHTRYRRESIRFKELLELNVTGPIDEITLKISKYAPRTISPEQVYSKLFNGWCYLVDTLHFYFGMNDVDIQVDSATISDTNLLASLRLTRPDGETAIPVTMEAYRDSNEAKKSVAVKGSQGKLQHVSSAIPFYFSLLDFNNMPVKIDLSKEDARKSTYDYQLEEFVRLVRQSGDGRGGGEAQLEWFVRNAGLAEKIASKAGISMKSWSLPD